MSGYKFVKARKRSVTVSWIALTLPPRFGLSRSPPETRRRCLSCERKRGGRVAERTDEDRRRLEDRLAKPMFVLALLFLVLLAGVIHRGSALQAENWNTAEAWFLLGGLAALWPIFLLDAGLRFFLRDRDRRDWKALARVLGTALFPPSRMATHGVTRPGRMWLPWLGWRPIDYDLQKTLERVFAGPMLFMAVMILPVLAVEYFWADAIEASAALQRTLAISVGVIWIAFTTEFIIRISAADSKTQYAFQHWVDLAVVVFPTVEFLPFLRVLRVTRVMRLDTIARMAKYYRIYGLAGKGWRGLVVLQLIQQLFNRSPQARLSRLQSQLESKKEEMRDLEREMDYYRQRIKETEREIGRQED